MRALELLAAPGGRSARLAAQLTAGEGRAEDWLEACEALVGLGDLEVVLDVLDAAREVARHGGDRALRASIAWRLGQVSEALGRFADAGAHYESAAELFRLEGEPAEEAVALLRLSAVRLRAVGAGDALAPAAEAIAAARQADDDGLLAEGLVQLGELYGELGEHEAAIVRHAEVVRMAGRAGGGLEAIGARAAIGLAEARLALGDLQGAIAAGQLAGPWLELSDDAGVRARSIALLGLLQLTTAAETGDAAEADAEATARAARVAFLEAGDGFGLARFLMRAGQLAKRLHGPERAFPFFADAWEIARFTVDRVRSAPIAYALARCHADLERWVLADLAIEEALELVEASGDLEGLQICTELGVLAAISLDVPSLAIRRLLSLARARGRAGDARAETRGLVAALELAVSSGHEDPRGIASELMDAVRTTGGTHLGPGEFDELAGYLDKYGYFDLVLELLAMRAHQSMADDRLHDGARYFARAAKAAWRVPDRAAAEALLERVHAIATELGMEEVEGIRFAPGESTGVP